MFSATFAAAQPVGFISARTPRTTPQSCAFIGGVNSGEILLVAYHAEGAITGISDTVGTSYSLIDSSSAQSIFTDVWVGVAAGTGANTASISGSTSFNGSTCVRLSSSYWTATADVHTNGSYTGVGTITTSSVTTTVNNDFFFAFITGFHSGDVLQPQPPLLTVGIGNGSDAEAAGYELSGTNGAKTVTFKNNNSGSQGNYVVVALKPVTGITITTASLPTASTTGAYSYQLQAIGGAGAYTWSISSGSLPTPLGINSSTGVISGTATGGTQSFTAKATDGTLNGTANLTLTVNSSAATPAFVQSSTGTSGSTGSVTATAGNVNVILQNIDNNTFVIGHPTDTLGTPYSLCGMISSPGGFVALAEFVGTIPSTGSNVVSISAGTSVVATEFSGVQSTCDGAIMTAGESASSATLTSGSISTVTPNSMLYAGGNLFQGTIAAVSPFTGDGTVSPALLGEYNLEASVSAYTPQFTQTGNTTGDWALSTVALRPSTSGVVNTSTRHKGQIF